MLIARRKSPLLTGLIMLLLTCGAPVKAWDFSVDEEDWGPTCFVTHKHKRADITILSAKGSLNPALLVSLPQYPKNSQNILVQLQMNSGKPFSLNGMVDDYFGQIYLNLTGDHINSFISARQLTISISDNAPIKLSLHGAGPVLSAFLRCTGVEPG